MKRWGFLSGATLAAIGVWAFYALTEVTDDDRLTEILTDHCLPYVTAGTTPFTELGRVPGVYDAVELRDSLTDGGARLIYSNRFVAQWGVVSGAGRSSRICEITPTYGENAEPAFAVDPDGFVARYADIFGLIPEMEALDDGPRAMGWYEPASPKNHGLRAVMIVSPGRVSNVVVMNDLTD